MPLVIAETDISRAWAKLLLSVLDNPGVEITPVMISTTGITADSVVECSALKESLDSILEELNLITVEKVAFTIFPHRLWLIANGQRNVLYEVYKRAFLHYQSQNPDANGRGLYFERLIDFDSTSSASNQLEWIISEYSRRKGVRRSMFQASVFDPRRDHTSSAQLGFPCLQHISFVPTSTELVINAFYATQQILNKAYGNYLGLARLGGFMAKQLGIQSVRLNVFIGVAKLEKLGKTDKAMLSLRSAALACITSDSTLSVPIKALVP